MKIIETNLSFGNMDIRNTTEQIVCHHSDVTVRQSVEIIHEYHKNTNYIFYKRKNSRL